MPDRAMVEARRRSYGQVVRKKRRKAGKGKEDLQREELAELYEVIVVESRRNSGLLEKEAMKLAVEETRAVRGL